MCVCVFVFRDELNRWIDHYDDDDAVYVRALMGGWVDGWMNRWIEVGQLNVNCNVLSHPHDERGRITIRAREN